MHDRTVFEARDEHGHLTDFVHSRTSSLENRPQIFEDLLRLSADVAFAHEIAVDIPRHLAGDKDEVSRAHGVSIGVRRGVVHSTGRRSWPVRSFRPATPISHRATARCVLLPSRCPQQSPFAFEFTKDWLPRVSSRHPFSLLVNVPNHVVSAILPEAIFIE